MKRDIWWQIRVALEGVVFIVLPFWVVLIIYAFAVGTLP